MRWPLAGRTHDLGRIATLTGGAMSAEAITGLSQVAVRLDPSLLDRLPFEAPVEPNTAAARGGRDVLWLGPDEWLVVSDDEAGPLMDAIAQALGPEHHAVVDVGANRALLELRGDGRRALLATRCPIDLHARAWGPGACAQTLFGRAQVILHERAEATRMFVRPSFAGYVVDLLVDAAAMSRPS
jgi:sarcosine oxidase subunit gamma